MKKLQNLKHIFLASCISLGLVFGAIFLLTHEFSDVVKSFLVYRTSGGVWQDRIYTHTLKPSPNISLITIDDTTLNTLQAEGNLKMLRIDKAVYTELVQKLEAAGVKGIAFDIIFQNADDGENTFVATLEQQKNIVIALDYQGGEGKCVLDVSGEASTCDGAPRSVYANIPWGMVNMDVFSRSVTRDATITPYATWKKSLTFDTLPLALARVTGVSLPQKNETTWLNPFFGPPGTYPRVSLIDVLSMSRVQLIQNFRDRYVFIGESGTAIHDAFVSPVTGTMMDGVESHAHFLDGLLQGKMLSRQDDSIFFLSIAILVLLTTSLYFFLPRLLSPIFAIVSVLLIIYVSRVLYDNSRIVVDILFYLFAGGLITYPVTYMYRFFVVEREKRALQKNFAHYVDPEVVKQIADKGEDIELGGERKNMTILFSDIAGFTTLSEQMKTQDLFLFMTSYLSNMTDILTAHGGTLDKYIGDAVMGFFGAPIASPDHAVKACMTAIAMRKRLPEFNKEVQKYGIPEINFRVGIATGDDVMVGNIGSHDRFNYTVLGDTVNLASRLEGAGKEYSVHIILSENTKNALSEDFLTRELDTLAVKGKTEGVRIYELLGHSGDVIDMTWVEKYHEALELYRRGAYLDAGRLWESLAEKDPTSYIMALRCRDILQGKLHVENGVYHMEHK